MGLSSVEATKVLRICAVRAMRSALLALLPLLDGFRLFEALLAAVFATFDFDVVAVADAAFEFVLLAAPVLPLDDFLFVEAERAAGFGLSESCPLIVEVANASASTTATHGSAKPRRKDKLDKALISSLYLYLCPLDA